MKKTVLCMALAALSAGSALNAAVSLTGGTSVSLSGILADAENAPAKNVMAYSGNSLYASGNFDTAFGEMSPLTTSDAFIIKYSTGMVEQWKVQLMGSATVSAMLADGDGGIYVAGTYADEVVVGSTDGNTKTINGYEEYGEPVAFKAASFVAHYNAEGVLLAVGTIMPTQDAELNNYATENGLWAMILEGDTYCRVSKLLDLNGSVHAVVDFKGAISTADNSVAVASGSYANVEFGLAAPSAAGAVVEFNDALEVVSFPVVLKSRFCGDGNTADENVSSLTAAAVGSQLYVAFNSVGTINVSAYNTSEQVVNEMPVEGGHNYGYTIVSANAETKEAQVKNYTTVSVSEDTQATSIGDMEVAGDKLIVTGMFQTALGFDSDITATSSSDMYVAAINTSDLNTAWAVATGYNEGDANDYNEAITGSAIFGDVAYIYGCNEQKSDRAKQASLSYSVDLSNATIENMNPEDYIFGMAGDGTSVATAHTTVPVSGITFTAYGEFAGVDNIAADKTQQVSVYPNPVADVLNFSLPCDAQVYALDGSLMLSAADAKSLDVTGLTGGVYIVKITVAGETSYIKIMKK